MNKSKKEITKKYKQTSKKRMKTRCANCSFCTEKFKSLFMGLIERTKCGDSTSISCFYIVEDNLVNNRLALRYIDVDPVDNHISLDPVPTLLEVGIPLSKEELELFVGAGQGNGIVVFAKGGCNGKNNH